MPVHLAVAETPDYERRGGICDVDRLMREDTEFDIQTQVDQYR